MPTKKLWRLSYAILSKSHAKRVWGPQNLPKDPKLSSHGIYIPNGCKHFKVFLQFFYGNEANSNKPLKNKKISGIERLILPFPDIFVYFYFISIEASIRNDMY